MFTILLRYIRGASIEGDARLIEHLGGPDVDARLAILHVVASLGYRIGRYEINHGRSYC